jgi:hypothetical protein
MTLAEELRGIKPRITSPGRFVSHDDPEPKSPQYVTPRTLAFDAWIKDAGSFIAWDAMLALRLDRRQVRENTLRCIREGTLMIVGELPRRNGGGMPWKVFRWVSPEDKNPFHAPRR